MPTKKKSDAESASLQRKVLMGSRCGTPDAGQGGTPRADRPDGRLGVGEGGNPGARNAGRKERAEEGEGGGGSAAELPRSPHRPGRKGPERRGEPAAG